MFINVPLMCIITSPPEEVHGLLKALVLFHFERQAEKLQQIYEESLQTMEAALPEVWSDGQNIQTPVRTITYLHNVCDILF